MPARAGDHTGSNEFSLDSDRKAKGETVKSYPFDDALKILADVLERDGKKSRRAEKDRRALEYSAARLSIRSAAQAYIGNKELWGIGPAKGRCPYLC